MKTTAAFSTFLLFLPFLLLAQTEKRPMKPADLYKLPGVSDPQVSPDGLWVAYTVTTVDSIKDSRSSDVWMVSLDGKINNFK
jgi:dipeptidyl aminopeptidase/acylaminoacyl peptidase